MDLISSRLRPEKITKFIDIRSIQLICYSFINEVVYFQLEYYLYNHTIVRNSKIVPDLFYLIQLEQ